MDERILTLHPQGKRGVSISRAKYETVRQAIIETLARGGAMTFMGLAERVEAELEGRFEGSIGWYYTTVKLDLEARGVIARVPDSRPQRIDLVKP